MRGKTRKSMNKLCHSLPLLLMLVPPAPAAAAAASFASMIFFIHVYLFYFSNALFFTYLHMQHRTPRTQHTHKIYLEQFNGGLPLVPATATPSASQSLHFLDASALSFTQPRASQLILAFVRSYSHQEESSNKKGITFCRSKAHTRTERNKNSHPLSSNVRTNKIKRNDQNIKISWRRNNTNQRKKERRNETEVD